jgi:hypothetical protein
MPALILGTTFVIVSIAAILKVVISDALRARKTQH